jgi:hypothetical protein
MTRQEFIYNTMKDVTNKTPILLVGGAALIFKRMYKGNIYRLENTEEVKNFISDFYNIEYNKPIVVEDLSLLYRDSILLKLVEEIKLPLILLATEDNISVPLQSRIKTYIKYPIDLDYGCNYIPILEAQAYIDENELTGKELDKYIAENCPDLAILYKDMEIRKNKDKLIQILGGIRDAKRQK